MLNPVRRRRRTLSMLFLCMGAGLLFWGALVLKGWLGGMPGKVYWFLCAYMAGMAVMSSLHEILASLSWMGQRSLELRVRRLALEVEAPGSGTGGESDFDPAQLASATRYRLIRLASSMSSNCR